MAQDSDFSLISVDADDEDDVVIQAGSAKRAVKPASVQVEPEAVSDSADASAVEAPAHDADHEAFERAKAKREAQRDVERLVTTEDDLKAPVPFAHMQRTIIILLVIAFALFLVYYFAVYAH